jgi:dephospho-CoA kinase
MIITITGRAGSGKDTVIKLLKLPSSYQIIDADLIGHECLKEPGVIKAIDSAFPGCIIHNVIDRKRLAAKVFPNRVQELNRIVHPCLIQKIKDQLKPDTIIHAALIKELELESVSDKIVLVESTLENTLQRSKRRFKPKDILRRLRSQRSLPWYRRHADYIIKNNGSLDELKQAVEKLCQILF